MKRPVEVSKKTSKTLPVSDQRFAEEYPTIVEYLSTTRYEDGSERLPSALSIFMEDGLMKVACNDKDVKRSLYASGQTLSEALAALDAALASPSPAWRAWNAGKRK